MKKLDSEFYLLSWITLIFILSLLILGELYAGVTGKISGKIIDAESKVPLPGVNVTITGTNLGAATDIDGNYFIINLPPGIYELKATMMGYKSQVKTNVRVNADHTTKINFALSGTVIPGEEVVIEAEKEVVKMDLSSSSSVVEAVEIQQAAFKSDFDQVFMMQPGWGDYRTRKAQSYSSTRFGVLEGREEDQGFQVRGGAEWEVNMMVDGISLKDPASGYQFTKLNLANIDEVQLLTGGFNAEYGEARSGVINVITKEGGDKYSFSLDVKMSPPGRKHWGPAINDTSASVYTSRDCLYGPYLGFGEYYDPDSLCYISFEGTEFTGNKIFEGWINRARASTPTEWRPLLAGAHHDGPPTHQDTLMVANFLREEWLWKNRPELWEYGDEWDYDVEGTFNGPVPFARKIIGPTSFFASYRTKYSEWMYPRAGGRNGGYNDYTAQLKFTNKPIANIKLQYNLLTSKQWGAYEYRGGWRGEDFPFGHVLQSPYQEFVQLERGDFAEGWKEDWNGLWMKPTYKRNHFLNSLQLTWVISPETFFDASGTYAHHSTDLIQAEVRDITLIPDESFSDENGNGEWNSGESFTDSNGDGIWTPGKYAKRIGIPGYWRYYDEAPKGRLPGESSFGVKHLNWQDDSYTKTWTFKANLTSQIDHYNQVKAGIQIIKSHEHVFRIKPKENGMIWYFDVKPVKISAYIQDKLEFKGMVANVGVRIDGFDPEDRYYDFNGNPFNQLWGNNGPGTPLLQSRQDSLNRIATWHGGGLNPGEIADSLMFNPPWKIVLSPRIGIAHPVSENGKIFFNYGHFYQRPRSIYLYALHQRANEGWSLREAGNPGLKMEKTMAWEVGYEHNILNMFKAAVSGYYKRISNEISSFRYRGVDDDVEIYSWKNNGYRNIRGVEVKLEKRVGTYITGWISYDYELHSQGETGYDEEFQKGHDDYNQSGGFYFDVPYDTAQVRRSVSGMTQIIAPSRSRIRCNIGLHTPTNFGQEIVGINILGDWNANLTFRWTEGLKFTYNPDGLPYVEENMQWKGYRQTDLKLSKLIKLGNVNATLYLEVYNLFNTKNFNMINYFGNPSKDGAPNPEPQKIYYDSIIDHGYQPGDTDKPGIILPWGPQHALYFPKRDIYFGISFNFR